LNYLAQKVGQPYDNGGMLARNGKISDTLLSALRLPLPLPLTKAFSLDNTWVREKYMPLLDHADVIIADQLASVTEFIASAIGTQIRSLCNPTAEMQLFITGGGAHNLYLIERILSHIAPMQCVLPERTVMDFKEAMLMSVCGMLRILHIPNAFASVTGASQDTINGKITSAGGITRKLL
jgi:anhydro-N-acetylmuramic acid kinase